MIQFWIDEEYRNLLTAGHLGDFESLWHFRDGKCLSSHSRGQLLLTQLSNGQKIFVKQDFRTSFNLTFRNFFRGRKLQANTIREIENESMVASYGIPTARVIAWGAEYWLGIPRRAVIVKLPVAGRSLDVLAGSSVSEVPEEFLQRAIARAEETLARLQTLGLDWKIDCKPEHFFIDENANVSLIDLERLRKMKAPLGKDYCAMQFERFRSLLRQNLAKRAKLSK